MIQSFGDAGTEDIFNGKRTKAARKLLPVELHRSAWRKLDYLDRAPSLDVVGMLPGNRLEALKGGLKGYWSIRINEQYRVLFQWLEGHASEVRIVDYH